ncbi:MAG: cupin domain-containing protein [Pseudomonadota bacterium]
MLFSSTDQLGAGPQLHVDDYDEIFIICQGRALFIVGDRTPEARAGDIVYGPAGVAHKFRNLGPGRLETTDIHPSARVAQVELPDPEAGRAAAAD